MAQVPVQPTAVPATQRIPLAEWLRLRRPPLPEFVKSLEGLPPGLAGLVQSALAPGQPVEGAIALPAEYYARKRSGWEWVPERALVFLGDAILLAQAESDEKPARITMLDAQSLVYVRSCLVLLYGLLEFKADCGGQPGEVRVEYNSVLWETIRPSLARFVAAANPGTPASGEALAASNAQILKTLPYKFANGLQYNGLGPGERLLFAVFQPEIRERRLVVSHQVTPPTVLALTDRKVILIEETLSEAVQAQPSKGEHGWVFTYIPRDRVVAMCATPQARSAELQLAVEWGSAKDERKLVLDPAVAGQWEKAWRAASPA